MTDKERMESACKDAIIALERTKSRLDNANVEYLQAIQIYHDTVIEYFNDIQAVLKSE